MRLGWVLAAGGLLCAQSDRASLTGRVVDPAGEPVPHALVSALHLDTNQRAQTRTSGTGHYLLPQLPTGAHDVTVEAKGFRGVARRGLDLTVAGTLRLDFQLEAGALEQTVEVREAAPALETVTSAMGTTIGRRRAGALPLPLPANLRNPEALVFLAPGVSGSTSNTQINGSQSRAKEILVDGASAASPEAGGVLFTYPSVEAIAEVRVLSSAFNAEYGRSGGGFEIFTTRGGTNRWHGAVLDYLRRDAFDARGFFAQRRAVHRQTEYGLNLGGPLRLGRRYDGRDRTFFFLNYTGFRYRAGAVNELLTLPTAAMRLGDLSALADRNGRPLAIYDPASTRSEGIVSARDPFPGARIPVARFSAVSSKILPLLPAPDSAASTGNFRATGAARFRRDLASVRLDHALGERRRLSAFGYAGTQSSVGAERLPAPFTATLDESRRPIWLRLSHDYVRGPATVHHTRAGLTREGQYFNALSANQDWPGRLGLGGVQTGEGNRFPRISFSDGLTTWGDEARSSGALVNSVLQLTHTVSYMRGNHGLRFGADGRWMQTSGADRVNEMGTFRYNSLETALPTATGRANTGHSWASFLLGLSNSADANFLVHAPAPRYRHLALFGQDDWRIFRRLTLNVGLRYDVFFPRTDRDGNLSGFDPAVANPGAGGRSGAIAFLGDGQGRDSTRSSFAETYWKAFGPRLGLAYLLTRKTVLRAGYGLYYGAGNAAAGLRTSQRFALGFNAAPAYTSPDQGLTPAVRWDSGFPSNWAKPPSLDPAVGNGTNVDMIGAGDGRPPDFHGWSFSVQREIGWQHLFEVSYAGVKGTRLGTALVRPNELSPDWLRLGALLARPANSPEASAAGIALPYPGFNGTVAQALRPFPQVLNIANLSNPNGNSTYHAAQAKLERRAPGGLTYLAVYSFSRSISDGDTMAGGGPGGQTTYNRTLEKAIATTDLPHLAAVSGLWEIPWLPRNRFLGGWSLSGIIQFSSGAPVVFTANNTLPLFTNVLRPDVEPAEKKMLKRDTPFDPNVDRWFNIAAFSAPLPVRLGSSARSYGKVRAPWFLNESVGVIKRTRLTERVFLVLRAEVFNIANRVIFAGPSGNVSNPDFGRISRQANSPRQGQAAVRVEF